MTFRVFYEMERVVHEGAKGNVEDWKVIESEGVVMWDSTFLLSRDVRPYPATTICHVIAHSASYHLF
jgi:hypothetical protein